MRLFLTILYPKRWRTEEAVMRRQRYAILGDIVVSAVLSRCFLLIKLKKRTDVFEIRCIGLTFASHYRKARG